MDNYIKKIILSYFDSWIELTRYADVLNYNGYFLQEVKVEDFNEFVKHKKYVKKFKKLTIPYHHNFINAEISDLKFTDLNITNLSLNRNDLLGTDNLFDLIKLPLKTLIVHDNDLFYDEIICSFTKLESLSVWTNDVTLYNIGSLTNLTELNISNNNKIMDDGIKLLVNLKKLALGKNTSITDDGLKHLSLTHLDLNYNNNITDDCIKNMPLIHLNLNFNNKITNKGIANLPLVNLYLVDNKLITDRILSRLPLKKLTISTLNITNKVLNSLTLTSLTINGENNITDDVIKDLKLKKLSLTNNKIISDKGIKNLPLEELILENSIITDDGLYYLRKTLRSLSLFFEMKITGKGIRNLLHLEFLLLYACHAKIPDSDIKNLPITGLLLYYDKNITIECIKNLPLSYIHAVQCNISSEELKSLPFYINKNIY